MLLFPTHLSLQFGCTTSPVLLGGIFFFSCLLDISSEALLMSTTPETLKQGITKQKQIILYAKGVFRDALAPSPQDILTDLSQLQQSSLTST